MRDYRFPSDVFNLSLPAPRPESFMGEDTHCEALFAHRVILGHSLFSSWCPLLGHTRASEPCDTDPCM
jgi:hypothetical protein